MLRMLIHRIREPFSSPCFTRDGPRAGFSRNSFTEVAVPHGSAVFSVKLFLHPILRRVAGVAYKSQMGLNNAPLLYVCMYSRNST